MSSREYQWCGGKSWHLTEEFFGGSAEGSLAEMENGELIYCASHCNHWSGMYYLPHTLAFGLQHKCDDTENCDGVLTVVGTWQRCAVGRGYCGVRGNEGVGTAP